MHGLGSIPSETLHVVDVHDREGWSKVCKVVVHNNGGASVTAILHVPRR